MAAEKSSNQSVKRQAWLGGSVAVAAGGRGEWWWRGGGDGDLTF